MKGTRRAVAALLTGAIAAIALTACGGSSAGQVVASVAGVGEISRPALEHWMPIEAIVLYQEHPMGPVPAGVVPDPPAYRACIGFLRTTPTLGEHTAKLTKAQLKVKCEAKAKELRVLTLNTLITWYWTLAAGKALGMKASTAEVERWLKVFSRRTFPKKGEYTTYLKLTGQTAADMLLRGRVQLFEARIFQKLGAVREHLPKSLTAQERQRALAKLSAALPPGKRWAAITTCRAGYVVSGCKEYRGSLPPGIPN